MAPRPEITGRRPHAVELRAAVADDEPDSIAADVLRGCAAIARFVGLNERDCFYKLERGHLPANKEGSLWVSSRSRLRAHYSEARYTPPPRDHGGDSDRDQAPPAPTPPRRRVGRPRGSTLVRDRE